MGSAREVSYYNLANEFLLSYTENLYLHYAQIPVSVSYNKALKNDLNVSVVAGVFGAYLFSAWVNPQHYYLTHEQGSNYNKTDVGFHLNASIGYKGRAIYTKVQKGFMEVSDLGGTNNVITLGLAYKFKSF